MVARFVRRSMTGVSKQIEQAGFKITPGGGTLRRRARVVLKLEQGKLAALLGLPRFQLLAAQFDKARPTEGAPVNNDSVGLGHGTSRGVCLGNFRQ